MTTVILITLACLYGTGIIITAGDAWLDEHHEREQSRNANLRIVRDGARERIAAARRRRYWSPLWPVVLIQALWRLRLETTPRHRAPRNH